ncbi:hypothetical protein FRC03_005930 [Tulasnella sp. 419]|nr:hypothetical protein FRC03_005930 [Tulasnella sp. 419]
MPWNRLLKCLESSSSTPAACWVATMGGVAKMFQDGSSGLKIVTIKQIRGIMNKRFDEMINAAPADIYLASFFFLTPTYHNMLYCASQTLFALHSSFVYLHRPSPTCIKPWRPPLEKTR